MTYLVGGIFFVSGVVTCLVLQWLFNRETGGF